MNDFLKVFTKLLVGARVGARAKTFRFCYSFAFSLLFSMKVLAQVIPVTLTPNDAVRDHLSGYEWSVSSVEWQSTNAQQVELLVRIAFDDQEPSFVRTRAMSALTQIHSDVASAAVIRLALQDSAKPLQRRTVDEICTVKTLEADEVVSIMVDLIKRDDAHLRARAASCLRRYPDDIAATQALVSYYATASQWEKRALEIQESSQ